MIVDSIEWQELVYIIELIDCEREFAPKSECGVGYGGLSLGVPPTSTRIYNY